MNSVIPRELTLCPDSRPLTRGDIVSRRPENLSTGALTDAVRQYQDHTRGGTTSDQKAARIRGVTDVLVNVLGRSPTTTVVVIDEVELDNWGVRGLPVLKYRRLFT